MGKTFLNKHQLFASTISIMSVKNYEAIESIPLNEDVSTKAAKKQLYFTVFFIAMLAFIAGAGVTRLSDNRAANSKSLALTELSESESAPEISEEELVAHVN